MLKEQRVKRYSSSEHDFRATIPGVTCHTRSHGVTCHLTQVTAPRITPARQAGTLFTYPGGMEG